MKNNIKNIHIHDQNKIKTKIKRRELEEQISVVFQSQTSTFLSSLLVLLVQCLHEHSIAATPRCMQALFQEGKSTREEGNWKATRREKGRKCVRERDVWNEDKKWSEGVYSGRWLLKLAKNSSQPPFPWSAMLGGRFDWIKLVIFSLWLKIESMKIGGVGKK